MSQFEQPISAEDLSSLEMNTEFVAIPIKTRSSSNSNVIDMKDEQPSRSTISPKKKFYSMDDIFEASVRKDNPFQKMSDCVPSPESDSSYASTSASGSSTGSSSPTCEISLLERLIRTHPIWFIPSLQRPGALHLLQGRDVGNFIVRSSTQPMTMAVSVKLPGNHVEHYLLKAIGSRISLENSTHTFETVHQLIAHYCGTSDEIPVCLRVPSAIAEATSRQQLRSLALLGQEFWSISSGGSTKDPNSPSDIGSSRNFAASGLGSQSSSSHSLSETTKKPSRPTTLELGMWKPDGLAGNTTTATPPPVPVRWSRSALLTPISQPSSVQSTPSEVQSTFSEKSGRPGRKKKRNSGGNKAESIHYKDTEILDLFKGTKTVYDDKASDYEDIWSPQYHERSHTPRLSTFKPDLIPSTTPEVDNINQLQRNNDGQNHNKLTNTKIAEDLAIQNMNIQNHRLSFDGQKVRDPSTKSNENINKSSSNVDQATKDTTAVQNDMNRKSGLYSEPVDSITFRKFVGSRNTEPNIRWSQPALSLLKVDFGGEISKDDNQMHLTGSGKGKLCIIETNLQDKQENANRMFSVKQQSRIISHRSSIGDVSLSNKSVKQMCASKTSSIKNSHKKQTVTCASVDNLCNIWDYGKKSQMLKCAGDNKTKRGGEKDEVSDTSNTLQYNANESGDGPAVETPLDNSNNKSWRLDNSWEFVMWQKEEEQRLMENVAKFPIPTPPNSPKRRPKGTSAESSGCSQKADSLPSTNNNSATESLRRFSRYDNLEGSKSEEDNSSDECRYEEDGQEKISTPWDSSKWEHLLRLVSESTQQLDSLPTSENHSNSNNASTHGSEISRPFSGMPLVTGSVTIAQVPKMLDTGGNVDKAGKSVTAVVRSLANKDDGVFGPTLKSFISCTIAAKVQDPYKVMRNVRQFISGMKNYLVGVNSESDDLRKEIKKQTETLSDYEFLNIDAILEEVLVELVISPLHLHIRGLIEAYTSKHGEPLKLPNTEASQNDYSTRAPQETNTSSTQSKLKQIYTGFEDSISPMTKLDKWNEFVCQVQEMENYSSDSFLPLLSETLRSVCTHNLPSHVDYMVGLLPASLADQNNYSLSLLQSAVSALKANMDTRKGSVSLTSVRVIIPDERNGTLIRKMIPVRNSTTNKEVAKIVASKLGITNPSDYVLVTIKNGEENICPESQLVCNYVEEGATALAYKRLDAKIGWPQKIS